MVRALLFSLFLLIIAPMVFAQEMIIVGEDDVPASVRQDIAKKLIDNSKIEDSAKSKTEEKIDISLSQGMPELGANDEEMIQIEPKKQVKLTDAVSTADLVAIGTLATGNIITATAIKNPTEAKWQGGVLFDDKAREAMRAKSPEARANMAKASDVLESLVIAYPIVDPIAYGFKNPENKDAAIEMSVVNVESLLVTALAVNLTKKLVARERPFGENCPNDPMCASQKERYVSFFSGHTAFAFTSAGLICAHHQEYKMYGDGLKDNLACWIAITAATTVGAMRIGADKHYASDVLTGAAIGLFSGYILPKLTHYKAPKKLQQKGISITPEAFRTQDNKQIVGVRIVKKF